MRMAMMPEVFGLPALTGSASAKGLRGCRRDPPAVETPRGTPGRVGSACVVDARVNPTAGERVNLSGDGFVVGFVLPTPGGDRWARCNLAGMITQSSEPTECSDSPRLVGSLSSVPSPGLLLRGLRDPARNRPHSEDAREEGFSMIVARDFLA